MPCMQMGTNACAICTDTFLFCCHCVYYNVLMPSIFLEDTCHLCDFLKWNGPIFNPVFMCRYVGYWWTLYPLNTYSIHHAENMKHTSLSWTNVAICIHNSCCCLSIIIIIALPSTSALFKAHTVSFTQHLSSAFVGGNTVTNKYSVPLPHKLSQYCLHSQEQNGSQ